MRDKIIVRFYCGEFEEDFTYPDGVDSLELNADLDEWVNEFDLQDIEDVDDTEIGWRIEGPVEEYNFDYGEDEVLDGLFMKDSI